MGGLDLIMPVLWRLRKSYHQAKITILIAELNKSHIFKREGFYSQVCDEYHIEVLDLLDLLQDYLIPFLPIFRILIQSKNIKPTVLEKVSQFLLGQIHKTKLTALLSVPLLLVNDEWWDKLPFIDEIIACQTKIYLCQHGPIIIVDPSITELAEQLVLKTIEDRHRDKVTIIHKHYFQTKYGIGVYRHVLGRDPFLPPCTEQAVSLNLMGLEGRYETLVMERLSYVGFPAFDRIWFDEVARLSQHVPRISVLIPPKKQKFRCLVILRDVVDKDQHRFKHTITEVEFIFQTIFEELLKKYPIELVIKPYPQQPLPPLKQLVESVGIVDYIIADESINLALVTSDLAVTVQTSGAYYPLVFGIPTIHILKLLYDKRDELFNGMEQGVKRVVYDLKELPGQCRTLATELNQQSGISNDVEHMRKYYPDGSIELIVEQLQSHLDK